MKKAKLRRFAVSIVFISALMMPLSVSAEGGEWSPVIDVGLCFKIAPAPSLGLIGLTFGLSYGDDYYALLPEHETYAWFKLAASYRTNEQWILPRSTGAAETAFFDDYRVGLSGALFQVVAGDRYHGRSFASLGLLLDFSFLTPAAPTSTAPSPELMAGETLSFYGSTGLRFHTRSRDDALFPTAGWRADLSTRWEAGADASALFWSFLSADVTALAWVPVFGRFLYFRPALRMDSILTDNGAPLPWFEYPGLTGVRGLETSYRDRVVLEGSLEAVTEFLRLEIPTRASVGFVGFIDAGACESSFAALAPERFLLTAGAYAELKIELPMFAVVGILKIGATGVLRDEAGEAGGLDFYCWFGGADEDPDL